jgi:hypothetical protein
MPAAPSRRREFVCGVVVVDVVHGDGSRTITNNFRDSIHHRRVRLVTVRIR